MKEETSLAQSSRFKYLVIIFFCFVASFLGSWLLLRSGLVKIDSEQAITQNRQQIVVQEGEVMAEVAKKVDPSVVSIVTESPSSSSFGIASQSAGTGVIVSREGYVITNKHVVDGAAEVSLVTSDGTTYEKVTLVGEDPLNDLAFLKIKDAKDLKPAAIGDSSSMKVGQKVLAIGNALGQYQNSVTSGIISGRGRPVIADSGAGSEQLDNLFQTDASINPGNSGGPLLNLSGEVIGINTAIAENAEGIGFAIPIDAAKGVLSGVLAKGKVERAYLGVRYVAITPTIAKLYKLSVGRGAYMLSDDGQSSAIVPGSPAAKAGLKDKDIITKVNDKAVDQNNGLSLLLSQFTPGEKITLSVLRGDNTITVEVTLARY